MDSGSRQRHLGPVNVIRGPWAREAVQTGERGLDERRVRLSHDLRGQVNRPTRLVDLVRLGADSLGQEPEDALEPAVDALLTCEADFCECLDPTETSRA